MTQTSLSVQWLRHRAFLVGEYPVCCTVQQQQKETFKKETQNLTVSTVNFKTSYFPAVWTSSRGVNIPPRWPGAPAWRLALPPVAFLPSPHRDHGHSDLPLRSPFTLCSRRTSGKALALRSIRPFSLSSPPTWQSPLPGRTLPCGLLMPPVTVSLGPVSIENCVFLGLSRVPSCSCFWQSI